MRVLRLLVLLVGLVLFGCSDSKDEKVAVTKFEEFYPQYNEYIAGWIEGELTRLSGVKGDLEERLAGAEDGERKALEEQLEEVGTDVARMEFRKNLGDYFAFKSIEDLPEGLNWEDGMDEAEIGDPARKRGGTFRYYWPNFPPTMRPFGTESNHSARNDLYDDLEIGLVGLHPETLGVTPAVAREWAVSEDKRTVYFRLDPDAKYNDGVKVEAVDVPFGIFLRVSDNVVTPYQKQYYREQFAQIAVYDEETLSITLANAKPLTPYFTNVAPAAKHFYKDYGPDYEERYQWKVPPTTGAYFVKDEDIVKGVSVTLTRAKDWWADDKKYYRNLYNPSRIRYTVVRDEPKAFELFKAGEIDFFRRLIQPDYWYEKSEEEVFFDGYIEKHEFYIKYPHIPWGLWLNTAQGLLGDRNVRLGLQHGMNMQRVIDVEFRGDYERLPQMSGGYGEFSDPELKAREFSVVKAREYFAKAGFTTVGGDGILETADGTR
ncbi:MAG: ABC transporter substrate-binding protein [Verrucomicrobiota bacterium]